MNTVDCRSTWYASLASAFIVIAPELPESLSASFAGQTEESLNLRQKIVQLTLAMNPTQKTARISAIYSVTEPKGLSRRPRKGHGHPPKRPSRFPHVYYCPINDGVDWPAS